VAPRDAVRALAIGRIVLGVLLVLAPRRAAAGWVGHDALSPGASVIARALGVRDAIFGGMVLHTVDHPQVGRRWLGACAVADAVDAAAAFAVRDDLPPVRGRLGMLVAGGSAVAHAAFARGGAGAGAGGAAGDPEAEAAVVATPPAAASSPEAAYPDGSQEAMRSMGARTEGAIPAPDQR